MLYRSYRSFMAALSTHRHLGYKLLDEERFHEWLRSLEPEVRASVVDDYRRGYWATIAENAKLADAHCAMVRGGTAGKPVEEEYPKPWSKKPVVPEDAPFTCTLCGEEGHIAKICPHNKAFRVIAGLDK